MSVAVVEPARMAAVGRSEDLAESFRAIKEKRFADAKALRLPYAAVEEAVEHAMLAGIALGMLGEVDGAGALFERVAGRRPMTMHPVEDLMRILRDEGRELDGLPHAEEAVRRRPDDARAMLALSGMMLAHLRPADAEAVTRRALELVPRSFSHLNQLGISLTEQGRHEDGLALFRDAASVEPTSNVAWTNMACTLSNIGRFDDALEYYRRSIMLKPDNPAIRLNHAICLLKAGRPMQGWVEYQWRLQLPGHSTLPQDRLLPSLARMSIPSP